MQILQLHFSGICRPVNPGGEIAFAFIVKEGDKIILETSGYSPENYENSSGQAGYKAIISALESMLDAGLQNARIMVSSDNYTVVNQIKGVWNAGASIYYPLYKQVVELKASFPNISFAVVSKEENSEVRNLVLQTFEPIKPL